MSNFRNQLRTFARSPSAFRESLLIDSDGGAVPFGSVMDPWQRADFEAMDSAWLRAVGHQGVEGGPQRAYLERPRGHSKTLDLAVSVLWALAFSPRQISGVAAAADRTQAKLLRHAIDKLVRLNQWLADAIDVQHSIVRNVRTGSELETLSSDVAASFGRTPDFLAIDELTHWQSRGLWESLISAAAKRKHCIVICIANAGFIESWQRGVYETVQGSDDWYFSRLDGPVASWIDERRLAEQRRLLPEPQFRRLWLNEWSTGSGDALQADDIEAAVTLGGPAGAEAGYAYYGGLDLGISRDRSALAVVGRHVGHTVLREREESEQPVRSHLDDALVDLGFIAAPASDPDENYEFVPGSHRLRLASIQSWKPPRGGKVDLMAVEQAVVDAHHQFGLRAVLYDPYQAEQMAQGLRRRGIRMVPFTASQSGLTELASTVLESFNSGQVELYRHETLLTQLRQLRIIERTTGGFRLDSPRNSSGHGDLATAFSLALLAAKRYSGGVSYLTRPLLHAGVESAAVERIDSYDDDLLALTGGY